MKPKAIHPRSFPWFDYSRYSFSLGLQLGRDAAVLSGHSGSQFDSALGRMVVRGDVAEQARVAYAKIFAILDAVNLGFHDVIRVVENVTPAGLEDYEAAVRVRSDVFGRNTPAVNTIVVHALLRRGAMIEIEVSARRGGGQAFVADSLRRVALASAVESDSVVYLSTLRSYNEVGQLVGENSLQEQMRQIFGNAQRILMDCGLSPSSIVKTVDMIRPEALAAYCRIARIRREFLGTVYPAAVAIVQERTGHDDRVLVSSDIIASRSPAEAIEQRLDSDGEPMFSEAVRSGNTLFMSSQSATDCESGRALFAGDVVAQSEYTYRKIAGLLEKAGLGVENLTETTEYVTPAGLAGYRSVAEVRKRLLAQPFPASTGVVCHSLAQRGLLIEVDPTARLVD